MNELVVAYLCLGVGIVLAIAARGMRTNAAVALLLAALPVGGVGLGAAFC